MICISPPELDEKTLLAYLDGQASRQVAAHIEECPGCRERAEHLAQLQGHLTRQLYRIDCPSPLDLGQYHLGVLPDEQAAQVSGHLTQCPHCRREIAQLRDYMDGLAGDVEFSPLERVRIWIAELVGGGQKAPGPRAQLLAPAFAGVRGEEQGPRLYQAGPAQVAIEIQTDTEQPDLKMALGLVTNVAPGELKACLWRDDVRVAEVTVDELGNFVLPGLIPARYELILSGPEVEIHIQNLDV